MSLLLIVFSLHKGDNANEGADPTDSSKNAKTITGIDQSDTVQHRSKSDKERLRQGAINSAIKQLHMAEQERIADTSTATTSLVASEAMKKSYQLPAEVQKVSVNVRYLVIRKPTEAELESSIRSFKSNLENSHLFENDEIERETSNMITNQLNYPKLYKLVIFNQVIVDEKPRGFPWVTVYNGDSIMESNNNEGISLSTGGFSGYETPKGGTKGARESNMERYKHLIGF